MPTFAPMGEEDPIITLCRMVMKTSYTDLPQSVVNFAKYSILDTLAVIIGGSAMEGIPAVVDLVKSKGGKPESVIPLYGGRVPASEAALATGPMARAMDFGQVHVEGDHCTEYTVPALLAATGLKEKVTGKEFLLAFTVGQEVLIRIGMAFLVNSRGASLGREQGHFIFGAAASVAKLLGLSQDELENAEGIAREMTQPHDLAMYAPPTLMVRVHHGFVCQDAINACLLAKRGITGPRHQVLAAPKGYLGFATWETEPEALTNRLGEKWEMLDADIKPYPSCKCTHTSVEGILAQMQEHNFEAEDIAGIDLDEGAANWAFATTPKEVRWNPQTVPGCQFSVPYLVATAACTKNVFLDSYTPEAMARKDVRELMTRITANEDPSLPPFGARIKTTLKNGKKYTDERPYAKGSSQNPMTEQELVNKFKRCVPYSAYKLSDATVDSVIKALLNLEKVDDVAKSLILPLTPPES